MDLITIGPEDTSAGGWRKSMSNSASSEAAKAVVRRNTEEVQGKGDFEVFADFHAVIHWQTADREIVTTFKTYHGTHTGMFLGVAPTGRKVHFETVDAMRVHDGKITEHWGVANLFFLMQQLGAALPATRA